MYRKVLQIDGYYRERVASLLELGKITTAVSPPSSAGRGCGLIGANVPLCEEGLFISAIPNS